MFRDEFPVDAQVIRFFSRIDIGSGEEEGPSFFLEGRNHFLNLAVGVLMARIFQAIGGDEENDVIRPVFRSQTLLDVPDFLDAQANRIEQGRAAAGFIAVLRKGSHFPDVHMVMDGFHVGVKEEGCETAFPFFFLLFLNHPIQTAQGVGLIAPHGPALVNDAYQFRSIDFFHFLFSLVS